MGYDDCICMSTCLMRLKGLQLARSCFLITRRVTPPRTGVPFSSYRQCHWLGGVPSDTVAASFLSPWGPLWVPFWCHFVLVGALSAVQHWVLCSPWWEMVAVGCHCWLLVWPS